VVRRLSIAVLFAGAAVAIAAARARAEDQKVAIGYYHWSQQVVNVNLGQRVTWYWVGPDTMHSVTGVSADDATVDSDPSTNEPEHKLGDKFSVTFDLPGTYDFQCKLHSIVRGEVVVSALPGDPNDDPEPVPPLNVNLVPPTLSGIYVQPRDFSVDGTTLHWTLDEPATLDAEIWRVNGDHRRTYAGWRRWSGHIGFDRGSFAGRSRHFLARPGRYIAYLTATDAANNASAKVALRFTIAARARG
jgi:plastocyanin